MPHWLLIPFVFALGSCIGSFLNVVVWRLPRNQSLLWPPSQCPKCNHRLAWYDNLPVIGWILLRGKCRYCSLPISSRYPIIEAITGVLFVAYYVAFFIYQLGPCITTYIDFGDVQRVTFTSIENDWPVYGLIMFMICGLLAASLIDAELYIIPIEIPWLIAGVAILVHALIAEPGQPGRLSVSPLVGAMSAGALVGLLIANGAVWLRILPRSFPDGEPMLDFERAEALAQMKKDGASPEEISQLPPVASRGEIRHQIAREAIFLAIPLVLSAGFGLLAGRVEGVRQWWLLAASTFWVNGLLASALGAMVAGLSIWVTRIIATFTLGRVAMGQGDTHLMLAIGAVLGAGPAIAVFFTAPFFGLALGAHKLLGRGTRELPYGPSLSLAAAAMVIGYRYIDEYFGPGMGTIADLMRGWMQM